VEDVANLMVMMQKSQNQIDAKDPRETSICVILRDFALSVLAMVSSSKNMFADIY
jgi:hypothetical protein